MNVLVVTCSIFSLFALFTLNLDHTTNDKMLENGIFCLKYSKYNQKEFSWIYSDSPWETVQNPIKRFLIELMFEKEI